MSHTHFFRIGISCEFAWVIIKWICWFFLCLLKCFIIFVNDCIGVWWCFFFILFCIQLCLCTSLGEHKMIGPLPRMHSEMLFRFLYFYVRRIWGECAIKLNDTNVIWKLRIIRFLHWELIKLNLIFQFFACGTLKPKQILINKKNLIKIRPKFDSWTLW